MPTSNSTVSAQACIWMAWAKDSEIGPYGEDSRNHPPSVDVPSGYDQVSITASGSWTNGPGLGPYGPDGDNSSGPSSSAYRMFTGANTIQGVSTSIAKLVGLWQIGSDVPPIASTYEFAIGSNLPDSAVPPYATKLFLGFHDGFEWTNNLGSVNVTLVWSKKPAVDPPPVDPPNCDCSSLPDSPGGGPAKTAATASGGGAMAGAAVGKVGKNNGSGGGGGQGSGGGAGSGPGNPVCSAQPIRYATGEIVLNQSDLTVNGFGIPWGHTRSYAHRLTNSHNWGNGYNWLVAEWTYLSIKPVDGVVIVMGAATQPLWFDRLGETFTPRFSVRQQLRLDAANNLYKLYDLEGGVTEYSSLNGMLVRRSDAAGNTLSVISTSTNGLYLQEVQRVTTVSGITTTESFVYTYDDLNAKSPLLQTVIIRRQFGAGAWANVQKADYTYYADGDDFGASGDIRTVVTSLWNINSWAATGTSYYRYDPAYADSSSSSSSGASDNSSHLLRYVTGPAAYDRLATDPGVSNPLTAPNSTVALYADYYFEYDNSRRVTREIVNSGSQSFQFSSTQSSFPIGANSWQTKTVETLPDGNQNIIYSNYAGQTMLSVFQAGDNQWRSFYRYRDDGKIILTAEPSAVSGFDESYADLLHLNSGTGKFQFLRDDEGLIHTYTYHAPTGWIEHMALQQGQLGTSVPQLNLAYRSCCESSSSSSSSSSGGSSTTCPYFLASETVYPSDSDPSIKIVTSYQQTFYPGTCALRELVTTLPAIPSDQNGSGVANSNRQYFDSYGNLTWKMDERGFITRMSYDITTGAILQQVQDVDTSLYPDTPSGWTTPSGGGLNVVTDLQQDSQGRTTQTLGPSHTIDVNGTATLIRTASWTVYDDANHVNYSGQGFATGTSPSYAYTLINPVTITKMDANGRVNEQIQAASSTTSGSLAAIITTAGGGAAAFPQTAYTRWTTNQYTDCCLAASQRVYHTIPPSGVGSSGTNYDETDYGYDIMKRRNRSVSPGGTITDLVFEPRGLVIGTYIGTNDDGATEDDPTGGGVDPDNNMVIITGNEYDDGLDGGDGNLTETTQYVDASTTRVTTMTYDFRNRGITTDGEIDYFQKMYYDNLSRVVKTERYDTTVAGHLIARSEANFDDLRRVYQSIQYAVDPSTGMVGNSLTDNTWYDASGNVIKSLPAGSGLFTKTTIDSLGRLTIRYSGYDLSETSYADAFTVTNDVILEQAETTYDAASNAIQATSRQRYHNAPDTQKGTLQNPSTTPKARVTYSASWQDGVGRTMANVNYGTNGGASLSRPSTVPTASDAVLVIRTTFDSDGNTLDTTDPVGMVTRFRYDAAGRKVLQIDNYQSSNSSSSSSSSAGGGCAPSDDTNRMTEYTFTPDGQQATLVALNASTGDQTTTWTYGTTLSDSDVASSLLLRSVTYPDSTVGSDLVSYSYNRQGQQRGMTDQRGCVHVYEFDKLGRPTHDRVTTPGSGVDTNVLRLSTSYEVRGMATKLTSWNNASVSSGSVVNECQFVYNTFGQLITDYQEHGGAVNISTSPKVQYGYANGSANTIRPTTLTYPDGRVLTYSYGTTNGIDDTISRVSSLIDNDGTTHLADYSFVGMGAYVVVDYTQPDVKYTLVDLSGTNDPDTGDIYSGWDRFGRVKDCRWYDYSHSTDAARLKYGYDRASDRLWRADLVAQSHSKNFDELYSYDGLHRLKDMRRGVLNGTNTAVSSENFAQCWSLDPTSNWSGFREAATGGAATLIQSRTANKVNEISGITNSADSAWITPAYDAAGNTTTLPQPVNPTKSYTATYDAWNRLVNLIDTLSSNTVQQNAYDARTFRTKRQDYTSGTLSETRHFYFTSKWQSVEERLGTSPSSANPERQQVWGQRYVDDLVLRDRDTTGGGTLNEQLYGVQDANWNVVALTDNSAVVRERYAYSPFGLPIFLTADMSSVLLTSAFANEILFTGQRFDGRTHLQLFRNRWFDAIEGRFLTRDPLGHIAGLSAYAGYFVPDRVDPFGTNPPLLIGGGVIMVGGVVITAEAASLAAAAAGMTLIQCLANAACYKAALEAMQAVIDTFGDAARAALKAACITANATYHMKARLCGSCAPGRHTLCPMRILKCNASLLSFGCWTDVAFMRAAYMAAGCDVVLPGNRDHVGELVKTQDTIAKCIQAIANNCS